MISGFVLGTLAAGAAGAFSATSVLPTAAKLGASAALGAASMTFVWDWCIMFGLP
jgi:hypothetical protein